jgi:ATP-dependent RNA helicase SUPV3L1/SUV3
MQRHYSYSSQPSAARVVAVLGPTNTGKTYLALDRMLGHGSGMMGFPLRLLARENYDRAVAIKGPRQVALITGEEKIVPPYAKYFFCTVESMPLDKRLAFVAVDEIQLAADPDRGHVFTERLLRARGEEETMFMGAGAVRSLIRRLVPEATFISRPRFSVLSFTGTKKILRLPPRCAVVGFSAQDVYTIAELIRRERGGAAVVLGALSPRTRNAQVAMFQDGEVDYLVATDAIGMGLNMDVDHVAFARLSKFDGNFHRDLRPDELAQIAGRAGRHMSDGTFGLTGDAAALAPEIIERIETHNFASLRQIYWRNPHLEFSSLDRLASSLAEAPRQSGLRRVIQARDEEALADVLRDSEVAGRATTADAIRLLWQVCQIPDYNRTGGGQHASLLGRIFQLLMDKGRLPADWLAGQVDRIDHVDGGIDTLMQRIADVRTWTYVSHRDDWLDDRAHWRERTRHIEERLSDALHGALSQRFVDARTTTLVRRLAAGGPLHARVTEAGQVMVESHFVGTIEGFKFHADATDGAAAERAVSAAASRALAAEFGRRVDAFEKAPDGDVTLGPDGRILWRGAHVGRVVPGNHILRPRAVISASELLQPQPRQRAEVCLNHWLAAAIEARLGPLLRLSKAQGDPDLNGNVRGILYQLSEGLGAFPRRAATTLISGLAKEDYSRLRRLGVWVGGRNVFMEAMIRPKAAQLCSLLWAIHHGHAPIPKPLPAGRVSLEADADWPFGFLYAAGYRPAGKLVLRIDIGERLIAAIDAKMTHAGAPLSPDLLNLAGCTEDQIAGVLDALGYRLANVDGALRIERPKTKPPAKGKRKANKRKRPVNVDPNSPFAKLQDLALN